MHVNRLEFSNSEAGDNFEIMRVCMGKRNWVITFFRIPSSTLFSLSFLLFVIYPQLLAAAQITCLVTAAFSWATVQLLARTKYRDIRASGFGLRVLFVTLEN